MSFSFTATGVLIAYLWFSAISGLLLVPIKFFEKKPGEAFIQGAIGAILTFLLIVR